MRTLWRLHIRPKGGKGDVATSIAFCQKNSMIGMGWPVPEESITRSNDLEWYKRAATAQYAADKSWHSAWTFAEAPGLHDLVWFRDLKGRYFLAEILSDWEYAYENPEAIDADIINYRSVRIVEVGLADAVPGKVIACFRPARTFQPIRSPGMLAFAEQLAGVNVSGEAKLDLYEFMSDADLENVIFVYLQTLGWYVLPGTRTTTTAAYEFVLVNRSTGERAITQVKSGRTPIDATSYGGQEKAFLFAACSSYGADIPENVIVISRGELNLFIKEQPQLLPGAVSTWIKLTGLPG